MSDTVFNGDAGRFASSRRGGPDPCEIDFIQARAAAGVSVNNICRMVGRSLADVQPWLVAPTGAGVPPPPREPRTTMVLSLWKGVIRVPQIDGRTQKAEIVEYVAWVHGVTPDVVLGVSRRKADAAARHEVMWRMYQTGRWSLGQIGQYLGNRDHTTVLHGIRRHQARLDAQAAQEAA